MDGEAELLAGIFLETLLTGVFLVVAGHCAQVLRQRARKRHHPGGAFRYLVATFALLAVLIVMSSLRRAQRTVVDIESTILSLTNPTAPGGHSSNVEIIMTNALVVLITIVADVFLVYRVYVVWNNWIMSILPALLCAGEIAGGVYAVHAIAVAGLSFSPSTRLQIRRGWMLYLSFTLCTNWLCTLLIAGRIWWIRRRTKSSREPASHDTVSLLITLVVDSAAIYSAVLIPEIICTVYRLPARYIFINLIGPVVGIVFSYLIVSVTRSIRTTDHDLQGGTTTGVQFSDEGSVTPAGTCDARQSWPLEALGTDNVHVLPPFSDEGDGRPERDSKKIAKD